MRSVAIILTFIFMGLVATMIVTKIVAMHMVSVKKGEVERQEIINIKSSN